jgi:hypothetical protein
MQFITKNSSHSTLHTGIKEKYAEETVHAKFLDIKIDNHINWKNHFEKMIPKLSGECFAIRLMVCVSNINTPISLLCIHSLL